MYVTQTQNGLYKVQLQKGNKVSVILKRDGMVLVEKEEERFWIREEKLSVEKVEPDIIIEEKKKKK